MDVTKVQVESCYVNILYIFFMLPLQLRTANLQISYNQLHHDIWHVTGVYREIHFAEICPLHRSACVMVYKNPHIKHKN